MVAAAPGGAGSGHLRRAARGSGVMNQGIVADNTVFHERGRESRVVLPVVPVEASKGG